MADAIASGEPAEAQQSGPASGRRFTPSSSVLPPATVRPTKPRLRRDLLRVADAGAGNRPLWLELHLELSPENYDWFEGSISPWDDADRPLVNWAPEARELLALADLTAPDAQRPATDLETRVLDVLPHLFSLGVTRVMKELALNYGERRRLELFPLIGFVKRKQPAGLRFEVLRMNVAVIDDVIVTIRLPNLLCPRGDEPLVTSTDDILSVPRRFLPSWEASGAQVAEEVARHQAATARRLADLVREELKEVLKDAAALSKEKGLGTEVRLKRENALLDRFERLTQIAEMVDRQVARLLRRMGSYGEDPDDEEAADIRRRYGYALDEIRALGREVASARDAHVTRMETERQAEREQFQFIAALVGSAILIPTLIAGIFGANVWLPGEEHAEGFVALIALIVAFATGGTWLLEAAWRRRWRPPSRTRATFGWIALVALALAMVMLIVDAARVEQHEADSADQAFRPGG